MKVMNVGNVNYANTRQQNFGMNISGFNDEARALFKPGEFEALVREVAGAKTSKGRELSVDGLAALGFDGLVLSFSSGVKEIKGLIVNKEGNNYFYHNVLCELRRINDVFETVFGG